MNFELLLFCLLVVTGIVSGMDILAYFGKRRAAGAKEPWWIEYRRVFSR